MKHGAKYSRKTGAGSGDFPGDQSFFSCLAIVCVTAMSSCILSDATPSRMARTLICSAAPRLDDMKTAVARSEIIPNWFLSFEARIGRLRLTLLRCVFRLVVLYADRVALDRTVDALEQVHGRVERVHLHLSRAIED